MRNERPDDEGVSLIELILYMLIAGVILALVSATFINGWMAQASTTDRDAATGQANLVSASLQKSIRNAGALSLTTGTSDTLVARVATGIDYWRLGSQPIAHPVHHACGVFVHGQAKELGTEKNIPAECP